MKIRHILLFSISFLLLGLASWAQEQRTNTVDSIEKVEKYGLRVGIDLIKPIRSAVEKGYSGFELVGDFRVTKRFYAAAEFGNEKKDWTEPYVSSTTNGSYTKLGFDYNAYENWLGMENSINLGLRYGFSFFDQQLTSYRIYTDNPIFPSETNTVSKKFTGLNAHWIEFIFSVKTELLNNLYLSVNLQLKRILAEKEPENFANLYIPGFNRTYDYSKFGVGYGYTISYLLPIIKKKSYIRAPD